MSHKEKGEQSNHPLWFCSTGNLNEKTALAYGDHCLLTSDRNIMADVNASLPILNFLKPGTNI
jgi:polyphosphate kinase